MYSLNMLNKHQVIGFSFLSFGVGYILTSLCLSKITSSCFEPSRSHQIAPLPQHEEIQVESIKHYQAHLHVDHGNAKSFVIGRECIHGNLVVIVNES